MLAKSLRRGSSLPPMPQSLNMNVTLCQVPIAPRLYADHFYDFCSLMAATMTSVHWTIQRPTNRKRNPTHHNAPSCFISAMSVLPIHFSNAIASAPSNQMPYAHRAFDLTSLSNSTEFFTEPHFPFSFATAPSCAKNSCRYFVHSSSGLVHTIWAENIA